MSSKNRHKKFVLENFVSKVIQKPFYRQIVLLIVKYYHLIYDDKTTSVKILLQNFSEQSFLGQIFTNFQDKYEIYENSGKMRF